MYTVLHNLYISTIFGFPQENFAVAVAILVT